MRISMFDIEQLKKMSEDELYELVDKLENPQDIDVLAFYLAEIAQEEQNTNQNESVILNQTKH